MLTQLIASLIRIRMTFCNNPEVSYATKTIGAVYASGEYARYG